MNAYRSFRRVVHESPATVRPGQHDCHCYHRHVAGRPGWLAASVRDWRGSGFGPSEVAIIRDRSRAGATAWIQEGGVTNELCFMTATELVARIRAREVSVCEVLEAHLAQIERVNPRVNAIVTLTAERARADARAADAALERGEGGGPLFGLPVAHKDLVPTRGIRTTFGSPIYRDHVPDHDGLIVERLREAGAITVGKTNTPEFGAGSQTFNEVFGRTLNPYDLTK